MRYSCIKASHRNCLQTSLGIVWILLRNLLFCRLVGKCTWKNAWRVFLRVFCCDESLQVCWVYLRTCIAKTVELLIGCSSWNCLGVLVNLCNELVSILNEFYFKALCTYKEKTASFQNIFSFGFIFKNRFFYL